MSILIKGMEMPTNCWMCPLSVLYENPRSMLRCKISREEVLRGKIDSNCPLVELPAEHGRLGDLDAMAFDESEAYMSAQAKLGRDVITTGLNSIVHRKIQLLIMDTPTIIEAEVSE